MCLEKFLTSYSRLFENLHATNGEEMENGEELLLESRLVYLVKFSFIINKSLAFALIFLV